MTAYTCICPGQVWLDTKGERIQAHGRARLDGLHSYAIGDTSLKRKLTTFVAAGAAAFGGAFLLTGAGGPLAHGSATNLEAYGGCYTYNTFSGSSYCASADADSTGVKVCYGYMDIESDQRTCQNV